MRSSGDFARLLEPLDVRQVKFRNRMVKAPQHLGFAAEDGSVSQRLLDYYEALARGGVGAIVTEAVCVDYPIGIRGWSRLRVDEDRFVPALAGLARVIHGHRCPIILQINHNGPAHKAAEFGLRPVAASSFTEDEMPIPDPRAHYDPPRALTLEEINQVVDKHVQAAWRAREAGVDGVEVHAGHSYLVNSFLSRIWNRREDDYGCQSLENRARLAVEIVRAVRARVGEDFVVGVRINGQEWGHDRGITIEESKGFAKILEGAGVDYIHVTAWGYGRTTYGYVHYPEQLLYPEPRVPLARQVKKPGVIAARAAAIKQGVSVPVIAVGRLDPLLGEWLLRQNMVDAIALGRRLIADPDLPRKVAEGRLEDIRPCMGCLECRTDVVKDRPISCRVNPALGREREYEIKPAAERKKVLVVGGGPAGMEAARVAAARGHEVVLYERAPRLGGSIPLAALVKGTEIEDLPSLVRYFETQLRKLGVRVRLGQEFRAEMIQETNPDAVILATGGVPAIADIRGMGGRKVISSGSLRAKVMPFLDLLGPRLLHQLTRFWLPVGKKVVIIGGLMHGCQLATFLVKRRRKVTIVETSNQLGEGIPPALKVRLLSWLAEKGVTMHTNVTCEGITDEGLVISTDGGVRQVLSADSVLIALQPQPDTKLREDLEGKVPELHVVGDCREPRTIKWAITDGSIAGHTV